MPTAIRLEYENISLIAETLNIPEEYVREEYLDATKYNSVAYYVRDVLYGTNRMPYLIYNETEFLDDFTGIPTDIDKRFVKVTQIKGP